MYKIVSGLAVGVGLLSGCAAPSDSSWWDPMGNEVTTHDHYQFDFAWGLAGDEAIAPLQLFNNSQQVWLQYAPMTAPPAVFALTKQGVTTLTPYQQGAYWVVDTTAASLWLRANGSNAWAFRTEGEALAKAHATALLHQDRIERD